MDEQDPRLAMTIGDAVREFVNNYGLDPAYDVDLLWEHDPCHIFSREISPSSKKVYSYPDYSQEFIAATYQIVLNNYSAVDPFTEMNSAPRLKSGDRLSAEEVKHGVEHQRLISELSMQIALQKKLTFDTRCIIKNQVTESAKNHPDFSILDTDSQEELIEREVNAIFCSQFYQDILDKSRQKTIKPVSDRVIEYHIDRARWIQDNIKMSCGKYFHEMDNTEKQSVTLGSALVRNGLTFAEERQHAMCMALSGKSHGAS